MTDTTPASTQETEIKFLQGYKKAFQQKMPKAIREAVISQMSVEEGRTLVDTYYQRQKDRLALENQIRAIVQGYDTVLEERPFALTSLKMDLEALKAMELNAKTLLAHYVEKQPVGQWLLSIVGIGPVIAATLIAHIDIRHANNPGQIVRFAGMDPSRKWLSTVACTKLLSDFDWEASETMEKRAMIFDRMEEASGFKAVASARLWEKIFSEQIQEKAGKIAEDFLTREGLDGKIRKALLKGLEGPALLDPEAREALFSTVPGRDPETLESVFQDILEERSRNGFTDRKKKFAAKLVMCPWNRTLKQTCYHIGESFVKTKHVEGNVYFDLYAGRLQYETANNEKLLYKDQAEASLNLKTWDKSTDAYKAYIQGKLPASRLIRRAKRWTIKIFVGHLWEIWRQLEGLPVKEPYAISHLENHSAGSKIPIPNQDLVDELLSR